MWMHISYTHAKGYFLQAQFEITNLKTSVAVWFCLQRVRKTTGEQLVYLFTAEASKLYFNHPFYCLCHQNLCSRWKSKLFTDKRVKRKGKSNHTRFIPPSRERYCIQTVCLHCVVLIKEYSSSIWVSHSKAGLHAAWFPSRFPFVSAGSFKSSTGMADPPLTI